MAMHGFMVMHGFIVMHCFIVMQRFIVMQWAIGAKVLRVNDRQYVTAITRQQQVRAHRWLSQ